MKLGSTFAGLLLLATSSIATANAECVRTDQGKTFDDVPYKVALSSRWSDKRILAALGLRISRARISKDYGVDGVSATYEFVTARVKITRAVGAVNVLFIRSRHDTVHWELCTTLAALRPDPAVDWTASTLRVSAASYLGR